MAPSGQRDNRTIRTTCGSRTRFRRIARFDRQERYPLETYVYWVITQPQRRHRNLGADESRAPGHSVDRPQQS